MGEVGRFARVAWIAWAIAVAQGSNLRHADAEASVTDRTQAQLLFNQARSLMSAGKYGEACDKFAESQRLDPGGGTILNLALCHEKQGKTASAWADFNEALSAALRDRRAEREKLAREHIAALEPHLPRLVVETGSASKAEGLEVKIDGREVSRSTWGTPVPIDPDEHVVEATMTGRDGWTTHIVLQRGQTLTIRIPDAVVSKPGPAAEKGTTAEPEAAPADRSRTTGYVTGAAGIAALGVGVAFGLSAIAEQKDADRLCPDDRCTPEGLEHNRAAQRDAWIADGFVAAGIVAAALGAYWIFAPNRKSPASAPLASRSPRATVSADVMVSGGAGLVVRGTW
jgi:hypothetical protein